MVDRRGGSGAVAEATGRKSNVSTSFRRSAAMAVLLGALAAPTLAGAVPPWSRKYATSCITCHTVYPKLTPFGEAFRRNGLRFPGAFDSDYVKQEVVALGQEASKKDFPKAVWPSFITSPPPLGFGANGRVVLHPTRGSDAAIADNRTVFSLDRLLGGGTLFAAGSIDDQVQAFAVAAFNEAGASLEQAHVVWADVIGPRHLVNLVVGNAAPTLAPFERGSSYAGGRTVHTLSLAALYGGTGAPFRVTNRYNLLELNGTSGGRVGYSVGVDAGGHVGGTRPAENFYGHVSVKLGGMRLDGEGASVASSPDKPWAEYSATLFGFGYRSATRFTTALPGTPRPVAVDVATAFGGGLRVQLGSLELNGSALREDHGHVTAVAGPDGRPGGARQLAVAGELSYVIYPWLVPAARIEHVIVEPDVGAGANASRMLGAVQILLRPNMKLAVTGLVERASGLPEGGAAWTGDGFTIAPRSAASASRPQLASLTVAASFAF